MSQEVAADSLRFESFEAYLNWEDQQTTRYELHDGYVIAMAGASEMHNRIADNVALLFNQHYGLRGRCHAFRAEMKLRVGRRASRETRYFRIDRNSRLARRCCSRSDCASARHLPKRIMPVSCTTSMIHCCHPRRHR